MRTGSEHGRRRAPSRPGPPRRDPPEPRIEPSEPSRPYDPDADRRLGGIVCNELRRVIRSGEPRVGVPSRSTRDPETWSWSLAGPARPDNPDFLWRGEAYSEAEAFDAFAACWARWLDWAGLEQVGDLQR